jgi:ATP-dependent exoDNAse (exonuclease V) beta subunit
VAPHAHAAARALGSTKEEISAAIAAVQAVQRHALWKKASSSSAVRREAPLLLQREQGTVVEGAADLAFRDGEGWTVVDFKTDFELEERRPQYQAQLAAYSQAIARATGLPAVSWLLQV